MTDREGDGDDHREGGNVKRPVWGSDLGLDHFSSCFNNTQVFSARAPHFRDLQTSLIQLPSDQSSPQNQSSRSNVADLAHISRGALDR